MPADLPTLRVRLTAAAERQVRCRHPWVFDQSISRQNREGESGELAVVYDKNDTFLAIGLYDPDSPIRIRILHAGKPAKIEQAWWQQRLQQAVHLRRKVSSDHTTGLRWIYGENDGWPGLVLDAYGKTLVVKLYSAAWYPHLKEQLSLFQNQFQCERVVLRLSRNIQTHPAPERKWVDGAVLHGTDPGEAVIFKEDGIRMRADVVRGQKTGFFLDQRDNRRRIGERSGGKSVLNLFSFSGGFSLHAARGGAKTVSNVDISPHALRECQANWTLNTEFSGFSGCQLVNLRADVFDWLKQPQDPHDIVIIDPPSLAKRKADREGALKAYHSLAVQGQKLTRPGGTLLCCSCSAHVSREDFVEVIRDAVRASRSGFEVEQVTGHAADHPHGIRELDYLKAVFLRAPA